MIESYRISEPGFLSRPEASHKVELMIALDSLRSVLRWYENTVSGKDTPESKFDQLMALVCLCGWGCAAIETLQRGKKKKWLSHKLFVHPQECLLLWEEITDSKKSERLKLVYKMRNSCFGHFDTRLATKFIDRNRGKPVDEIPPVLETSDQGKFLKTVYPWAYAALAIPLYPEPFDYDEARRRIGEVVDLVVELVSLLHSTLNSFADSVNLQTRQVNESWFGK